MKPLVFAALAAATLAGAPAAAAPDSKSVRILNTTIESGSAASGNSAQAQLTVGPFRQKAVVLVSANGEANYEGSTANAGIILSIKESDHLVRDDSFEAQSNKMQYHAAATHLFVLARGETRVINVTVEPWGAGATNNKHTKVHMHVVALAAD